MVNKRTLGKQFLCASLAALSHRVNIANGGQVNNISEIDVSRFTHAIFPREHGQLVDMNMLAAPLVRRYPSREHCMQMAAFYNSTEAILVIGNDPAAAICDWILYPNKKLTLTNYGKAITPLIVKVDPNVFSIANAYRKWVEHQYWMKPVREKRKNIDFFSVASMSDFNIEKEHFKNIRRNIAGNIGVWFTQWRRYPFDKMYPDYVAKDKAKFFSLIKYLEINSAIAMPYINSLLVDVNNKMLLPIEDKVLLKDSSGGRRIYSHKANYLSYACPGSRLWKELIASACLNSYQGMDAAKHGIYLDMLAAASPELCWSSDHGHTPGDAFGWQRGLLELLREMKGVVMVEGCAEIYLNSVDYCLMHLYTRRIDSIPLWRYVYGDLGKAVGWTLSERSTKADFQAERLRMNDFGIKSRYGSPWMLGIPESSVFNRLID